MTTPVLTSRYLDRLTRPEPRLPGLSYWLLNDVWSEAAFEAAGRSLQTYLLDGERWMNALETLMTAAGDRLYAELADPRPNRSGSVDSWRRTRMRRWWCSTAALCGRSPA